MLELNADQKRNLLTTLEYVDKLLCDSGHVLEAARSPSFLPEYVYDITWEQHEKTLEHIARFREEVRLLLKRCGLMPSRARKSAAGAVITYLLFADMALEEIDSKSMDHGKLSDEAAWELDMVVAKMRLFIRNIRLCLDSPAKSSPHEE